MKLWKLTLVAALVLVAVLALASCGCEHVYDEAITIKPTCTAEGEKTFTCSLCGEVYTEPVAATGHTYTDKVVDPTCTEDGYTEHTCACGDTYKDNTVTALGHENTSVVTAPTCSAEGYTTYTCGICGNVETGDITAKDSNAHNWIMIVAELTAEQAAANPHAIGVEVMKCTDCGQENATENAVLVNLTFDGAVDPATYKGSTYYDAAVATGADEMQQKILVYIDEQKHLDSWNSSSGYKGLLSEDGKFVATKSQVYVRENLPLFSVNNPFEQVTVTVDIGLNADPATAKADYARFFGWTDEKLWNNFPFELALDKTDVDESFDDEVKKFHLVVANCVGKKNQIEAAKTDTVLTLGKEYTFKLDLTIVADAEGAKTGKVTVSYKEVGAAEFTVVGTYENLVLGTTGINALNLVLANSSVGNTIDNYKVTTTLAK